jgi:hypothetical protein
MGQLHSKQNRRGNFYMYLEDALGGGVQSASIMWERVESLLQGSRDLAYGEKWKCAIWLFFDTMTAACTSFIEVRSFVTLTCMLASAYTF